MDPLPQVIALCAYCQLPLYADGPVAARVGEPGLIAWPMAHVACAVDARRER